jgi:hypothetical protein
VNFSFGRDAVADKLTPLMTAALARAAAEPTGVPLHAGKSDAGLFPNTTLAKAAAKRCLDEDLLKLLPTGPGKKPETAAATDKGLHWLLAQQNPKAILEDLVRVLESKQAKVAEWVAEGRQMAECLRALQATLTAVLPRTTASAIKLDVDANILAALMAWGQQAGGAEDCPLPRLFQMLLPACSLGLFHDALRRLHAAQRIYLHPWTGPLYACPQPSFGVLVGHEVAWYASLKTARVLPHASPAGLVVTQ